MGNVSPMEILNGTPESIEQAVIDCFRKCWDNPRGFTIAPGCDIPVTTSLEISMLICVQQENAQNIRFSHQTGNKD